MELRHLRYFVAVAEEENVTRAASRLHVSQPPLTRQIQELEKELGLDLFTRTAKSIHLTEAGRVFMKEARAVLARVETAVASVRAAGGALDGELNVGYAPTPTAGLLAPILRAFKKLAPGVRVTLHDSSSCEMIERLNSGAMAVAFIVQQPKPVPGIVFETLREYPAVLAVAPDHPLARRRSVTVAEVLKLPFVVMSRRDFPDYHLGMRATLGSGARRVRIVEECDSGTSFVTSIESGRGVGISSASMAFTAGRRLRLVPFLPATRPVVVGIAYRGTKLTPLVRRLVEIARTEAARG